MSRRIETTNVEDFIKSKILENAIDSKDRDTRIFHYGIVTNNVDPLNANRVKVRIPFVDDNFYINKTKEQGDDMLPWCVPSNKWSLDTPDQNSIISVAVFDTKIPHLGRMYFDCLTELSKTDIFDYTRSAPDSKIYSSWSNVEHAHNVNIGGKPKEPNAYNVTNNVNYKMGIRGRGNNKLMMTQNSVEIYQNEKTSKESLIKLTEDVKIESSNIMELLSKKGGTKYHPVFDEPLYAYLTEMNAMIKEIVLMLASKPSINSSSMQPNLPSTKIPKLVNKLQGMYNKFNELKNPGKGASKYLYIN